MWIPERKYSSNSCPIRWAQAPLSISVAVGADHDGACLALPDGILGDVNPRWSSCETYPNGLTGEAHLVEDLLGAEPDLTCDLIWSNPPIRVGKSVLHDIMRTWLPRLSPGGVAYLVVNKNLGGDSLHKWIERELGFEVERVGSRQGFRVLAVTPTS